MIVLCLGGRATLLTAGWESNTGVSCLRRQPGERHLRRLAKAAVVERGKE
jgi:hypothetical protein